MSGLLFVIDQIGANLRQLHEECAELRRENEALQARVRELSAQVQGRPSQP